MDRRTAAHKMIRVYLISLFTVVLIFASDALRADPCLVVYPACPCTYRYDTNEYYTVSLGHPLYDPEYDRGGKVLLEVGTDAIDESIYQAPEIIGFEPSVGGNEGYYFEKTDFELIIDGFSNQPTTYVNVLVVFDDVDPFDCIPEIWIDGGLLTGYVYEAGDLEVSTPTGQGSHYSDTITLTISWSGCSGLHMWAFSDENYNGEKDGGECFTAFSHDITIPVEHSTWGSVKSLFE